MMGVGRELQGRGQQRMDVVAVGGCGGAVSKLTRSVVWCPGAASSAYKLDHIDLSLA